MHRTGIVEQRISSVATLASSRADVAVLAVGAEPVVRVGLVALAAQGAREALAVPVV